MSPKREYFDVGFAKSYTDTATSANHLFIVATTAGYFYGMATRAVTGANTVYAFDDAVATTGTILATLRTTQVAGEIIKSLILDTPMVCTSGCSMAIVEDGAVGVVYFAPKG